ncbi:aldolase/citrate lyase family protein [Tardisphaera miroshnichenkoae]
MIFYEMNIDKVPRAYIAGKALQSGIQNFLFANIRDEKDAEETVNSVRLELRGKMSVGNFRVGGYVFGKFSVADYRKFAEDAVIALMIEKRSALDHLEEILSVKGFDMIQFSPWDHGLSIGLSGKPDKP